MSGASDAGELLTTLSLLTATLDATADGILVVDLEGGIASYNQRFVDLWGIPEAVLEQRDDAAALGYVLGLLRDPDAFVAKVQSLYSQPEATSEDTIEFHDGRIFERISMPQRVDGRTVGRVWSFRDVTERKRIEHQLSHQAFHDSLTGLPNQALFRDRVSHALARSARRPDALAVLFVDLDDFKAVNDSFGHTAGDDVLVGVAERLQSTLRSGDSAARLGGDEFAVLLEDVGDERTADDIASRILDSLRSPFPVAGHDVVLSASIGIALGTSGTTGDQILRNADLAMYAAKQLGKSRYETFRTEMHADALDRIAREGALRHGLDHGELVLEYQPLVTLPSAGIVGFEALVRWQHPERGLLPPAEFVALAEDAGLVAEMGRQVLRDACSQMRRWQLRFPHVSPLSVCVNLSARQLESHDIVDDVELCLRSSGLPADSLVLELTEAAMMHDTEARLAVLTRLKELGIRLAVDDFGTGYSSLSSLPRFPVDILKIDRTFVSAVESPSGEVSLAPAILSLARTLQLQSVAEGVETEGQAEVLATLGCELAQGFYFARPMDVETVEDLLRSGSFVEIRTPASNGARARR